MINKAWNAEKRSYEKTAVMLTGKNIRVKDVEPGLADEVGYTSAKGSIHLAFEHPVMDSLTKIEKAAFRKGVFGHETLHQIFTDFRALEALLRSVDPFERNILGILCNVLEDPAIENYASTVMGGNLLTCLKFSIAHIYNISPNIEEDKTAMGQFVSALIHFGDMGLVKGVFTFPEAKSCFAQVAPLFYKGINEPVGKKRLEIAKEIFEISRPLWEEEVEQQKMLDELLKKIASAMRGSGSGQDGDPSALPGDDKKNKRRKATIKIVSKEEYEDMKNNSSENSSEIPPDGDITICICPEAEEDENQNQSGGGVSISLPMGGNESKSEKNKSSNGSSGSSSKEKEEENSEGKGSSGKKSENNEDESEENGSSGDKSENNEDESEENNNSGENSEINSEEFEFEFAEQKSDGNSDDSSDEKSENESEENSEGNSDNSDGESEDDSDGDSDENSGNASDESNSGDEGEEGDSEDKNDGDTNESDNESENKATRTVEFEAAQNSSKDNPYNGGTDNGDDIKITYDDNSDRDSYENEDVTIDESEYVLSQDEISYIKKEQEKELKEYEIESIEEKCDTSPIDDIPITSAALGKRSCLNHRVTFSEGDRPTLELSYQSVLSRLNPGIRILTKQLQKIFQNDMEEKLYKSSGKVNIDRMHSGRVTSRVFDKRRTPNNKSDIEIYLLLDESGSMSGDGKITAARETAISLAEVAANLNIPIYIMGFTADTRHYDVVHNHYITGKNSASDRLKLLSISTRSCNCDGYSIRYITQIAKKSKATHKLLIVCSDGQPNADRYYNAIADTKDAIREAKKNMSVLGVAVGNDDTDKIHYMYESDFLHINNVGNLYSDLAKKIKVLIRSWE